MGGNASSTSVAKGFELILKHSNVKVILVNIFAGIVRCDRIAKGIIEACQKVEVHVPIVVRLDGTNASIAAEIIKDANISNIIVATSLEDGAKKSRCCFKSIRKTYVYFN